MSLFRFALCVCLTGLAPALLRGEPPSTGAVLRPGAAMVVALPSCADDAAPEPDEDLDDLTIVLTNWTRIGAAIQTLEGNFTRHTYDATFRTEQVGAGRVRYEAAGRALYVVDPPTGTLAGGSTRLAPDGTPYTRSAAAPQTFYWVYGQFAQVNLQRREFELFEVPEAYRTTTPAEAVDSWDILWTQLGCLPRTVPGLIETDLDALQRRFEWRLDGIDENRVILSGRPRSTGEKRLYSAIHVHLDAETYATRATKVVDPTGTREVVHVFEGLKINVPADPRQPDWAPDLARLTLLSAPPLAPPAAQKK